MPRRLFLETQGAASAGRTRALAAAGPARTPASALTWPVMPVMSATFLGLPISPSPEPRALGQRTAACAMSLPACGGGLGGAEASGAEAAAPKGRGGVPEHKPLRPGCKEGAHRAASRHNLTEALGRPGREGRGRAEAGPTAGRRGSGLAGAASFASARDAPVAPAAGPAPRDGRRATPRLLRRWPCGQGGAPEGRACRRALSPLAGAVTELQEKKC